MKTKSSKVSKHFGYFIVKQFIFALISCVVVPILLGLTYLLFEVVGASGFEGLFIYFIFFMVLCVILGIYIAKYAGYLSGKFYKINNIKSKISWRLSIPHFVGGIFSVLVFWMWDQQMFFRKNEFYLWVICIAIYLTIAYYMDKFLFLNLFDEETNPIEEKPSNLKSK